MTAVVGAMLESVASDVAALVLASVSATLVEVVDELIATRAVAVDAAVSVVVEVVVTAVEVVVVTAVVVVVVVVASAARTATEATCAPFGATHSATWTDADGPPTDDKSSNTSVLKFGAASTSSEPGVAALVSNCNPKLIAWSAEALDKGSASGITTSPAPPAAGVLAAAGAPVSP